MAMRTGSQDAAYSDHNVTAVRIIRHTKNNHLLSFRSDESDEGYGFRWSVSGAWRKYIILCRFHLPIFGSPKNTYQSNHRLTTQLARRLW